ncbi:hypothetical protein [Pelosinus sp. UFO1]|uniref:hypothetical protein n=1 Tax=Pelosinus sp. UFO1 TaxID=484770 RepID=UPI0004D0BFB6|nr:hypothetical protein [Pelosinus sp. UFO1]AIF51165.1 hypothetical protein UFO1_1614 [Pelosinus sp. UFO1]
MSDEKESSEADKPLIRKDLLDYVVKLNDREIGKTKNTGFTILALLSAVGAIGYKMFEFFPIYQIEQESLLVVFTALVNFVLVAYRLWLDLCNENSKVYLANGIRNYHFSIHSIMWSVIIFTAIFLNIKSKDIFFYFLNHQYTVNQCFIYGYIFVILSNPIQYFIYQVKKKIKKVKYEITNLRIDAYNFWVISYMQVIVPIIFLGILIINFDCKSYLFYFDDYNNFYLINSKVIKLSCLILAICILVVMSIRQSIFSLTNKYSESIEKNIIASNLSIDEIRGNVIKHFGCQTLHEWIQEQYKYQEEYKTCVDDDITNIPTCLNMLKYEIVDKKMKPNEIYFYIIESNMKLTKHRKEYEKRTKELKLMWVQVGLLSYEANKIDEIIRSWDANFDLFKNHAKWFEESVENLLLQQTNEPHDLL